MRTITKAGIEYKYPEVILMNESGLGTAEFAGRTAYDSFEKSENESVKNLNKLIASSADDIQSTIKDVRDIEKSNLLHQLAWVHHHMSVLEHINLSYFVKGTSRAVLQEHARHRLQGITVKSTRYTMSSVINAFNASNTLDEFTDIIKSLDMFVITGTRKNLEIHQIWDNLVHQELMLEPADETGISGFLNISTSREQLEYLIHSDDDYRIEFQELQSLKQKRNVGDNFKHIVTDNWKTDFVFTMNLRTLKNYLDLRNSGAAYFQIRMLAEEIIEATPKKYLDLVMKT